MEDHRRWQISLRLRKLADAGVQLDQEARALADEFRPASPEDEEREEFRVWSGAARWMSPKEKIPPSWQKPGLDELVTALQNGELSAGGFEAIALARPCTAYLAIRQLGVRGNWPLEYWQRLLWAAMHLTHEKKLPAHRERNLADLLSAAPRPVFAEIDVAAADFIGSFANTCPVDDEGAFHQLWERAWTEISDATLVQDDDTLTQALNSAPGKLGEAALHRLWKYEPKASGGLPEQVAPYFDTIAVDDAGRLGRVMLATQLSNLFSIDPAWTSEKLLPKMNWAASGEARDLWTAYAWSASAGPNLLHAFKPAFLEALRRYDQIGEQRSNLVYLFTSICLEVPSAFTSRQIHDVIRALPEGGLVAIGYFLEEQLNGGPEERADQWRIRIAPWLARYWPSEGRLNTTATSLALVGCLLNTGNAFPDAVGWALEFLRPGTDHILWRVQEGGLHKNWPSASLDLLIAIVPGDQLPPWECQSLREILDEMRGEHHDVEANQKFVSLYRRAIA